VIQALGAAGCFAGGLHGREQKGDQNANNRDDNQQFHERKGALFRLEITQPHELALRENRDGEMAWDDVSQKPAKMSLSGIFTKITVW
jgi:hypothetical protein